VFCYARQENFFPSCPRSSPSRFLVVCVHAWWNFLPVGYEYVYNIALPYLYPTDIIFSYFCSKLQHDSYILLHANRDFVTNGIIFAILECVQNVTTFYAETKWEIVAYIFYFSTCRHGKYFANFPWLFTQYGKTAACTKKDDTIALDLST
jgi:hypothetical protein